jgi:radical SAM superfamily enzyme with C-terminal helix-hairpin-helix motif
MAHGVFCEGAVSTVLSYGIPKEFLSMGLSTIDPRVSDTTHNQFCESAENQSELHSPQLLKIESG